MTETETETDLNNKVSHRLKCTLQYQNKPGEKIVDIYQGAQDRLRIWQKHKKEFNLRPQKMEG